MRKQTVPVHRIDTQPVGPEEPVDTSFDEISPDRLLAMFEARYAAVLPRLITVVMGQLAFDKALRNIEASLQGIAENLRPATPENHATIEAAHTQAYRYAVISESLRGVVADDVLHDTTLRFMEAHTRPQTSDPTLRKMLSRIDQSITAAGRSNGVQPNPNADEDPLGNPFGVNVPRAKSQPEQRRGGRVKT